MKDKLLLLKGLPLLLFLRIATAGAIAISGAWAQVSRGDFTGENPFELFVCPVLGLARNYGIAASVIFVFMMGLILFLSDKGGDDKGIWSVLKIAAAIAVGVGIILLIFFTFEDWIVGAFGPVCAAQLG